MRYLAFILSMPNRGSWNGKWSGAENFYCIVKKFGANKKGNELVNKILNADIQNPPPNNKENYFYYNFGDGWGASVTVKEIDAATARVYKKKSNGFCAYDWMVNSIINYQVIKT